MFGKRREQSPEQQEQKQRAQAVKDYWTEQAEATTGKPIKEILHPGSTPVDAASEPEEQAQAEAPGADSSTGEIVQPTFVDSQGDPYDRNATLAATAILNGDEETIALREQAGGV